MLCVLSSIDQRIGELENLNEAHMQGLQSDALEISRSCEGYPQGSVRAVLPWFHPSFFTACLLILRRPHEPTRAETS